MEDDDNLLTKTSDIPTRIEVNTIELNGNRQR